MGASPSSPVDEFFDSFKEWQWQKTLNVVKVYTDGEYDFGVDFSSIMAITGLGVDDAKMLVRLHAKNDSGTINALTMLVTIAVMSDAERRNEYQRYGLIFDLFDFNRAGNINLDELAILLLCVTNSFSFILGKPTEAPQDADMIELAQAIYTKIGKRTSTNITKEELQGVIKEFFFKKGLLNVDSIFERISQHKAQALEYSEEADPKAKK